MIQKAYAKVNIFLKILGRDERGYHELSSRFIVVKNLYDTLQLKPKKSSVTFELQGDFNCALEQNTIYKAYKALAEAGYEKQIQEVMATHSLHVEKKIPSFAGLGGGSSDAATFLHMLNEKCCLNIDTARLASIGAKVGADVPFFVYGYDSANVFGIGDIVKAFDEKPLHVKVKTPNVQCDTKAVYKTYKEFYNPNKALAEQMNTMTSHELLTEFSDEVLNDLLNPALQLYPKLEKERSGEWFFSGSGSSFFQEIEHG